MRTYLVTGGAGFIGSNYIHYMFEKYDNEIRIINVDKLTYAGNLENLKDIENRDNYTFVKADICDSEEIMKIFEENDIDRVVHFAAESHVDRSIRNPEVFVKTNVLGTLVKLHGSFRTEPLSRTKNSFMCLRMRSMVLWKKTVDIFMRQPPMRLTARTLPARHLQICW